MNDAKDDNDRMTMVTAPAVSENFRELPIPAENRDVLSDRQRRAIDLILAGKSLASVADHVQVSPRTLFNWRQDEVFRVELDRRRRALWDLAADQLRALIHPAIRVLEEEVHDEYDRSRIRAAGMILRLSDLRTYVPPGKAED